MLAYLKNAIDFQINTLYLLQIYHLLKEMELIELFCYHEKI